MSPRTVVIAVALSAAVIGCASPAPLPPPDSVPPPPATAAPPVAPRPAPAAVKARVRALLDAAEVDEASRRAGALLSDGADGAVLASAVAEGRTYAADVPRGWIEREYAEDGRPRPWIAYIPENYDPAVRWPVVFDLHGGVSRPDPLTAAQLRVMEDDLWGATAAERGWILVVPAGLRGAEWWSSPGEAMVLRILDAVKTTWNVDEDRVFATGFSDGASGSFYLALAARSPFAGFIPLNGHAGVAGAAGLQVHLRGLLDRPAYVVNTDQDSLYPSAALRPVFEALAGLRAPVLWHEITGYRHDPSYLPAERSAILAWMDGVRRDALPAVVHWEGADAERGGGADWIRVTALAPGAEHRVFPDVNPLLPPGKPRIGFTVDQGFEGPGVRISGVLDGTPAREVGLVAGDVIVGLDGADIGTYGELRTALGATDHGAPFRLRWLRDGETLERDGRFPPAAPSPAFRRERPWGSLRAEARGNLVEVISEGVAAFDIEVMEGLFDLAQPVAVHVNGALAFHGPVARDPALLLERALRDRDRARVVVARIAVTVATSPR